MKISFTQKEYRLLMELIYIARRVITSNTAKKIDTKYFALCRKLHALYQDMGAESFIGHDEKDDVYSESENFKKRLHKKYIQPYINITFWQSLILGLIERDLSQRIDIQKMNEHDRASAIQGIAEKYDEEFQQNGLDNVRVIQSAVNDDYFELKLD